MDLDNHGTIRLLGDDATFIAAFASLDPNLGVRNHHEIFFEGVRSPRFFEAKFLTNFPPHGPTEARVRRGRFGRFDLDCFSCLREIEGAAAQPTDASSSAALSALEP